MTYNTVRRRFAHPTLPILSALALTVSFMSGTIVGQTGLNGAPSVTEPTAPVADQTGPIAAAAVADPVSAAEPLVNCEIIARINGQVVQACDVLWITNQIIEDNRERIPPDQIEPLRKQLLQREVSRLVDTKLLYSQFAREVPAERHGAIAKQLRKPFEENELPRIMKQLSVNNRNELEIRMVELGSSVASLERMFRERTIASEWLRNNVKPNNEITHDEMLEYYNARLAEYEYPAKARWEELMVNLNKYNHPRQAYAAMCELGNAAYANINATPDSQPLFTELAKAKSDGFTASQGGQHDWTSKGALRHDSVDAALFTLPPGELSPILECDDGFRIVRVLERKVAGRTPFTEVQNEIRDALKQQRYREAVEVYLSDIRQNARIWTTYAGEISYERLASQSAPATR